MTHNFVLFLLSLAICFLILTFTDAQHQLILLFFCPFTFDCATFFTTTAAAATAAICICSLVCELNLFEGTKTRENHCREANKLTLCFSFPFNFQYGNNNNLLSSSSSSSSLGKQTQRGKDKKPKGKCFFYFTEPPTLAVNPSPSSEHYTRSIHRHHLFTG